MKVLFELFTLFLKLGFTSFGGPAAHIAMMKHEVVTLRNWLSESEFLDLLGSTNLIPGPNSTELAIHVGHKRHGFIGLLVAGIAFILPAMLIVWALAWGYVRFGSIPQVEKVLGGIKPVVLAIIIQAVLTLSKTAVKTRKLGVIGVAAFILNFMGANELLILFGAGVFSITAQAWVYLALVAVPLIAVASSVQATSSMSLTKLFLFFVKTGSVLFGSGYVLLAFLRADLVERWHVLTNSQLMDAIAIGQFTPGPVFTTATFIGYLLARNRGAIVATLGIFLPAFFFVAISAPLIPKLRKSRRAGLFLDGVNVASLSLMASVTWQLGRSTLVDWRSCAIMVASFIVLRKSKINTMWLILVGGIVGLTR